MSTYRLDRLFAPRSIAVVGGSPRYTSPGRAVLKNLRSGGFAGAVHLVNPHYESIEGSPRSNPMARYPPRRMSRSSPCRRLRSRR
jgi:acetyltransferase